MSSTGSVTYCWLAVGAALLLAAGCGGSSKSSFSATTSSNPQGSGKTIALVSDIGKFNDRSFNRRRGGPQPREQRARREDAAAAVELRQRLHPEPHNRRSQKGRHGHLGGLLLADATQTMAKKFPGTHFAITDYSDKDAPSRPAAQERQGLHLRRQRVGMPRRVARREMAAERGGTKTSARSAA